MAFLDSGGGKADPTGGGDPFGGGPGGSPGSSGGQMFAGDPTLTGDSSLPGLFSGAGAGGGVTPGDTTGVNAPNPIDNPQVGAPISQQPAPGTTTTSFGGVPSSPQTNDQLQQVVQRLSGGGPANAASPSLTQLASRGDIASDAPQPGVSGSGVTPTDQPLSMDALQGRTNTGPAATAAGQQAANAPVGNVPVGATGQPIPPSTSTTPTPPTATNPGQPPPGGASPEPSVDAPQPPPPPEPKTDTTTPTPPKTGGDTTTTPPPATGATPPATGATPPATGNQGFGGGSPTQQQGPASPLQIIGDAVRALFTGDVSPLLQDLAGQQAAAGSWESPGNPPGVPPWAPGYGPESRIQPGGREARRIAAQAGRAGRAGGGGTPAIPPTPGPSTAQQQGDVQAAIGKGERDPFGATGWPGQGQVDPLAPTAGRSDFGPMPDDMKQMVSAPLAVGNGPGQISRAFNGLKVGPPSQPNVDRSQFRPDFTGPEAEDRIYKLAWSVNGEVGRGAPLEAKLIQAETVFNRAQNRGDTIDNALRAKAEGPGPRPPGSIAPAGPYYQSKTPATYREETRPTPADIQLMKEKLLPAILGGSNKSDVGYGPMTGNASGGIAAGQREPGYKLNGGDTYFREGPIRKLPTIGPQSSLTPPARATGLDMLRGRTQMAALERPGMSPGAMSQAPDVFNRPFTGSLGESPPETTSDPRYEPIDPDAIGRPPDIRDQDQAPSS